MICTYSADDLRPLMFVCHPCLGLENLNLARVGWGI